MFKLNKYKTITGALILLAICFMSGQIFSSSANAENRPVLRGAATTNIKLESEASFANSAQPITVSLRDTDVKQALRMFSDKAGLNVVFHEEVKGKITMDLVDVPLGDAVKMITQMAELSYVVDGNTVMIMPNEVANKLDVAKRQLSVIPLKYVDAGSAADFLNANVFKKGRPGLSNSYVATANPVKNELILFGQEEDFKLAQKIISKIDVKPYISTYKVNHTTPKEMATMICETLFALENTTTSSNAPKAAWEEDMKMGGAYKACRIESDSIKRSASKQADSIKDGQLMSIKGASLTVSYMPASGNVQVVGGSPEQIQLISDFIAHNDRKQPQAYIEMSIVELSENGSKEFQNTWNIYSNFFTGSIGGDGIKTADNYPIFWKSVNNLDKGVNLTDWGGYVRGLVLENPDDIANAINEYKKYEYELDNYYKTEIPQYEAALNDWKANSGTWSDMPTIPEMPEQPIPSVGVSHAAYRYSQPAAITQQLNYVIQNGKGRVLSNPKIIVTNGKKSTIDLTADIVKSVTTEVLKSENYIGGGTQRTYNIGQGENGIKIEIVPFISPDGYVSMNLKPEYKTVAESIYASNDSGQQELQATLMRERSLELSNVRVKDGETLVLGGLVQEYESKSVSKTPILGDLPIIGFLFRNSSKVNQKSELVILITPRIIKDNEDVAGVTSL